jgi:xylulokinase
LQYVERNNKIGPTIAAVNGQIRGMRMAARLIAGVDCSTQATKVLVLEPESGAVVASGSAPHEVLGTGGARETDPDVWWEALRTALDQTGRAREVGALSVAAQQHGLVVTDARGRPLRPAILWNDTRSAGASAALIRDLGGPEPWAEAVGSVPVPSLTVTSWAWLKTAEPHLVDQVARVRLPHDHLTERLTGRGVSDRGDASGTGWWSPAAGEYAQEVLDLPAVRLDRALLPQVLGPADVAGEVTSQAAAELGLRPGTLVGPGTGDNMGAALGLGAHVGLPVVSLGTSGTIFTVSERPAADPTGTVAGFADATGRFLPLACTLNCTLAVDRVAAWLGLDREAAEPGGGVVVLPYLDGERTPNLPEASGSVVGLRHDTTPAQILGAAYEGAAVSLLGALDGLAAHSSRLDPDAPLVLVGGGAQGRAWREVIARLSGRPLIVPEARELVALGAAAQAAAALLDRPAGEIAGSWGTVRGLRLDPVASADGTVERVRSVTAALTPLFQAGDR